MKKLKEWMPFSLFLLFVIGCIVCVATGNGFVILIFFCIVGPPVLIIGIIVSNRRARKGRDVTGSLADSKMFEPCQHNFQHQNVTVKHGVEVVSSRSVYVCTKCGKEIPG